MKRNFLKRAAALLLMFVLLCSVCCFSGCSRKDEPDCTVAFILKGRYPAKYTEIMAAHLEQYVSDTNGDGEVILQYVSFFPGSPTALMAEFGYADSMLFITDAAPLTQYTDNFIDFFIPITETGETALLWDDVPGLKALDWSRHAINIQGTEEDVKTEQLEAWCSQLQISCRVFEGTKFEKDKTKAAQYQGALKLIEALQEE